MSDRATLEETHLGPSTRPEGSGFGFGEPELPERVGPYVVLERLGAGGMGVVLRAHDPRLDREVAVKLLRREPGGERLGWRARERLMREARAMAHVTHPNVVQVYDVGTDGERVFVAMELVEGPTLSRWLRSSERSVPEILDAFVQAGRGLQAAHERGLVHRDFKPDNVLVGADGRVRVTDFGLARALEEPPDGSAPPSATDDEEPDEGSSEAPPAETPPRVSLTRTGMVMGTPAYMAVEQHLGQPTDERSDQFSFCVALFEALAGVRPFSGLNNLELARAKQLMQMPALPARPGLRPAVPRAIRRGLDPEPERRWPSLAALLEVLQPPRRSARRVGLVLAGVGVLVAGLWWSTRPELATRCEAGDAQATAVWNAEREHAVGRAFVATGRHHAEGTHRRVAHRMEQHLQDWREAYREVCLSTARDPGGAADDGRMRCLDRRLARLEGLAATLEDADGQLVDDAVELVSKQPPSRECLRPDDAGSGVVPPTPEIAAQWVALEERVARVEVLLETRRGKQALALARSIEADVGPDAWPPMRAAMLHALGQALEEVGRYDEAVAMLTESTMLASRHGLDEQAARSAAQLTWVLGTLTIDREAAEGWARHARTHAERRGGLVEVEALVGTALGSMYLSLGEPARAEEAYRGVLEAYRSLYGERHPHVAIARSNLGAALIALGDYEPALEQQRQALEIWSTTLGPEHPARAHGLDNVALAYAQLGRYEEALRAQHEALELRRRASEVDDLSVATSLNNLGAYEEGLGRYERAEARHREALILYERILEPDDLRVVASRVNLGLALARLGSYGEAEALAVGAVSALERSAPDHPFIMHAWILRAAVAERRGDAALAREVVERALRRCEGDEVFPPGLCAEARFVLARAQWADPALREQARIDGRRAWEELRPDEAAAPALSHELRQWLAEIGEPVAGDG
ncbi:MAG: tetratricopeptide repeat protein [Myxococcales bacterium]|nr:tetratricopeptide repeat protein [Myxococcales bacterium]